MKLTVTGMTCDGCARAVTKAVQRIAPDAKVDVALQGGTVAIDGPISVEQASAAICDAGFQVTGQAA